jgi:general secretion pathway protein G
MKFIIKSKNIDNLFGNRGFTIIELIVVIAIISILSSIVVAGTTQYIENAKVTRARVEMNQIVRAIMIAQGIQGRPLIAFAPDSNCLQCYCSDPDSQECLDRWKSILSQIEAATNGLVQGLSRFEKDPWKHPYQLDANQGEGGSGNCSNLDGFWVHGKSISGIQPIPLSPTCP